MFWGGARIFCPSFSIKAQFFLGNLAFQRFFLCPQNYNFSLYQNRHVWKLKEYLMNNIETPTLSTNADTSTNTIFLDKRGGEVDQWEAWNWSCNLRATERPWPQKQVKDKQTRIATSRLTWPRGPRYKTSLIDVFEI